MSSEAGIYGNKDGDWLAVYGTQKLDNAGGMELLGSGVSCLEDVYQWLKRSTPAERRYLGGLYPSQKSIARHLGMSQGAITAWVTGRNQLRLEKLEPEAARKFVRMAWLAREWKDAQ